MKRFFLELGWWICFFYLCYTASKLAWICLGLHFIADFWMQGCLADLKQKKWWEAQFDKYNLNEEEREKYKFDFETGLFCHALMWSIITFFPLMFFVDSFHFSAIIVINMLIHAHVDNLKANKMIFSLFNDQVVHFLQVMVTVYLVLL